MTDDKKNIPQSIIIAHALGLISNVPEIPKHDCSLSGWSRDIKQIAKRKK